MQINTENMKETAGILKLINVIISIFLLGFLGHSYYYDWRDEMFLAFVIIFFIISVIMIVGVLLDVIKLSGIVAKVDMFFHFGAGVTLLVCCVLFLTSVISKGKHKHRNWERVFALLIGVVSGLTHGFIAFLIRRSSALLT